MGALHAEVLNNLGYSHMRVNKFEAAMQALDEAIRQNAHLQPALHNRAVTRLCWALDEQRPLDARAGTDIEGAINAGPPTADLYRDAARVYARLAKDAQDYRERIAQHLVDSLRLGMSPSSIEGEFEEHRDHPAVRAALANPAPVKERRKSVRLADPLPHDSFRPR